MTMTAQQGEIWQKIVQLYGQANPDWQARMPVAQLQDKLPAVPPELIGETLAQAATDQLAEVDSIGEEPSFKPLTH